MKKQPTKQSQDEQGSKTEGRLDQALTRMVSVTGQKLKEWRIPLGVVFVLAVLVVAGYTVYTSVQAGRDDSLSAAVYRLFDSTAAQEDGYQVDAAQVAQLFLDVRGHRIERFAYKSAAEHYLAAGERTRTQLASDPPGANASESDMKAAYAEATRIAGRAAELFPDDGDIQTWSKNLKNKVAAAQEEGWLPPGWKFAVPPPVPAGGDGAKESSP